MTNLINREIERLNSLPESNFLTRNLPIKLVIKYVLYPPAAIFSMITAGTHLYYRFYSVIDYQWLVLPITIAIVTALEVGKFVIFSAALDAFFDGVLASGNKHEKNMFFTYCVIVAFLFGSSAFMSIKGAPVTADFYKRNTNPVELVDLNGINVEYDKRVQEQKDIIGEAKKMTWKGVIVRNGQATIKQATANIAKINEERSTALSEARQENATRKDKYESSIYTSGKYFTSFAGLGEGLCFFFILMLSYYENGARSLFKQSPIMPEVPLEATAPIRTTPSNGISPQMQPIGFKRYNPKPVATELQPLSTPKNEELVLDAIEHCRKLVNAYKSKLKNRKGNPETNERQLKKWQSKMEGYKKLL